MFFHLVHAHKVTNALVFTKSAESTTRLVRLFDFFEKALAKHAMAGATQEIVARAYSSDLPTSERKSILEKFRSQEIQMWVDHPPFLLTLILCSLVCSDLISRGIDISHVSHVVSYDVPVDMRKYVHRVGRTARAGRAGDAWTLVEEQEVRPAYQMKSKRMSDYRLYHSGAIFQGYTAGGRPSRESQEDKGGRKRTCTSVARLRGMFTLSLASPIFDLRL